MGTRASSEQRIGTAEAERLWRAWSDHADQDARDSLVLAYAPMVRYLAHRKLRELPAHLGLRDLISSGTIALIAAVDRFDPARGATFEQYAWNRVSGAILDELRSQDWASRSVRRNLREIERARERWIADHGTPPSDQELAGVLELTVNELRARLDDVERATVLSLNRPARDDDAHPLELGDLLEAGCASTDPEAASLLGERTESIRRAIASLSERERTVLRLLYVDHARGADVGRALGVSESRVSQMMSAIRRKLRTSLEALDSPAAAETA